MDGMDSSEKEAISCQTDWQCVSAAQHKRAQISGKTGMISRTFPFLLFFYLPPPAMEISETFLNRPKGRGKVASCNVLLNLLFSLLPFWGPEPGLTLGNLDNGSNHNLIGPCFDLHFPALLQTRDGLSDRTGQGNLILSGDFNYLGHFDLLPRTGKIVVLYYKPA
jgi:hypothetical protein